MNKIAQLYSTLFFIGYIKPASGTFGTFFSILIIFPLIKFISIFNLIIIFTILFILGMIMISIYSKDKDHDSSEIVIDEFLGVFFIMLFYKHIDISSDLILNILIFFLFRFFDILKPFPARWIDQKITNSFGVIMDDIIAGIYCIITLMFTNVLF